MYKVALATAVGTSFFTTLNVHAQTGPERAPAVIAPSPMFITSAPRHPLSVNDMEAFQGQYVLDNGGRLHVRRKHRALFMALDEQSDIEMLPTAANRFVTRSGSTELVFRQAANGNVSGVEMRQMAVKLTQR